MCEDAVTIGSIQEQAVRESARVALTAIGGDVHGLLTERVVAADWRCDEPRMIIGRSAWAKRGILIWDNLGAGDVGDA